MTDCSFAIWKPSPNFDVGRAGFQPEFIGVHIEDGTDSQTEFEFDNPASKASSTYRITKQGLIEQSVLECNTPWTMGIDWSKGYAGYQSNLTLPLVKYFWDNHVDPNNKGITIEMEGSPDDIWTPAQVTSFIRLCKDILARNLTIKRIPESFIRHCDIDRITRSYCPGSGYENIKTHLIFAIGVTKGMSPEEINRYALDIYKRAGIDVAKDAQGKIQDGFFTYFLSELQKGHYLGKPEEPAHPTENNQFMVQAFSNTILNAKIGVWLVSAGIPL